VEDSRFPSNHFPSFIDHHDELGTVSQQSFSFIETGLPFNKIFLYQLLTYGTGLIWDNATIHRSDEVKAFLANGWAPKIHLENFPAYAPELNPDEGVWQYLKHVELRNLCCMDLIHLNIELQLAIRRLRRKQDLIQSFFAGAGLDPRG
jgi:transposase